MHDLFPTLNCFCHSALYYSVVPLQEVIELPGALQMSSCPRGKTISLVLFSFPNSCQYMIWFYFFFNLPSEQA